MSVTEIDKTIMNVRISLQSKLHVWLQEPMEYQQ